MKVTYDPHTDTLSVILKEDTPVAESDEEKPGVILDYDAEGNLVSIEVLDASKRVTDACKIEYEMMRRRNAGPSQTCTTETRRTQRWN
jgi:YD repeat-containing protein